MDDIYMLADIAHSFVDSMTDCASSQDHLLPAELSEDDGLVGKVDLRRAVWCHSILGKWLEDFRVKYRAALKLSYEREEDL